MLAIKYHGHRFAAEDEDGHAALTFTDITGSTVLTRRKEGAHISIQIRF